MATTLAPPRPKTPTGSEGSRRNGNASRGGFGGDGRPDAYARGVPARAYRTGLLMGLVAIVMLFAAFTSALVVRKGMATDWVSTGLPPILYLNTLVLLASSVTLELSRRGLANRASGRFRSWLYLTVALGVTFLAGQLLAWRELASRGVYLATNPSSSFFYLLTAAHGLHLAGGVAALAYVLVRARAIAFAPERRVVVGLSALYWHFMDGLWIYLLFLLKVRL